MFNLRPHPPLHSSAVFYISLPVPRATLRGQATVMVIRMACRLICGVIPFGQIRSDHVAEQGTTLLARGGIEYIHQPEPKPHTAKLQQVLLACHVLGTLQPYFTWATLFFERDTQPSEKSTRLPAQSVCLPTKGASGVINQVIGPASIHLRLLTGQCAAPTAHLRVQHIHQP